MINVAYGLKINGKVNCDALPLSGKVKVDGGLSIGGDMAFTPGAVELYSGPYTFTPTQSTQVVYIDNKLATENIEIEPIPSNYGLITWNGSFLTVS